MSHLAGSKKQLIHRIAGIEGHVRSLKKMIDGDRDSLEILMQLSAVRAGIGRLSQVIFEEYVEAALQDIDTKDERSTAIANIRAAMETLM